jgi:hypothetical protein
MSLANAVNTHTMRSLGPAGALCFAAIKQENERLRSMTDFRPAGYSAADSAGSRGKGDTRVPTRWRQVEARQSGHFCRQRSPRAHTTYADGFGLDLRRSDVSN